MQAQHIDQTAGAVPRQGGEQFKVELRVFSERLLVEGADGRWRERECAVLSLRFDYGGVRVGPVRDADFDAEPEGAGSEREIERNFSAERLVQARIERYGAVELDHLEGMVAPVGAQADYVINVDDNVHAICSFSGLAVDELRALGWQVEVDADFQFQVVGNADRWALRLSEARDKAEWFQLELGLEVDGEVIDLVPALIKLLEEAPKGGRLSSLSRQVARCRALPVARGRYVAIPWDRLEPVLSVLAELYDGQGRKLKLHEANLAAVGRLEEALAGEGRVLEWSGRVDAVERGKQLVRGPRGADKPAVLHAELRPYQQDGLTWLCHLRDHGVGGVLADDMGLGKTLQTIALLAIEKEQRRMDRPSLVIVPTSLIETWRRQIAQFAPHLRVLVLHGGKRHAAFHKLPATDVVLTTYSVLSRDLGRFREHDYHYVVLDEAQAIKNARSQASHSVRTLSARHRLALTGTPVENNLDELWSLFEFVMPGLLGNAQRFRTGFRYPIEREGNESRLSALRSRVSPFVLRRLKETVARDLPPKTELTRYVTLGQEQRDLYESIRVAAHAEVRSAIRRQGFEASSLMILDALTKLRQVCCDPRLVKVDAAREVTSSAKAEAFHAFLSDELGRGRRVLVFSQFARMLALLSDELRARGVKHVTLTGASDNRHELVDRFQEGAVDVFLISLKAGGTGLTLTRADTVIHYDPWWNAAAQMQATDRAHRIGQTQPVFVHNLVVAGSVEERMLELQQRKRALADTLLGNEVGTVRLFPDDIESLLAPLHDYA
ncbi:MAG: DEAD/DEAH box helicase [Polyangiaceae bacterium]|nr:DEAD/DEAH box helicase [Polyangiaceae bacterium]